LNLERGGELQRYRTLVPERLVPERATSTAQPTQPTQPTQPARATAWPTVGPPRVSRYGRPRGPQKGEADHRADRTCGQVTVSALQFYIVDHCRMYIERKSTCLVFHSARARAAPTGATRGLTSGAQCRHHSSTNWIFALSVSMSSKSAIIRSSSKSSSWMTMANR
jgi:hypothetical protein